MNDINKMLSLQAIGEKIFKIKNMYHPSLIANLSKEMYDLYVIRDSICDQLLELLKEKDIDINKVNDFIKNRIKENQKKLKEAKNEVAVETIKLTIEEWKQFI
ncbi:MAG: hypothetical protein ACFFDN_37245 [Candidatus Hodarchaeota archaeon]